MKNITVLAFFLLFSLTSFAQVSANNFDLTKVVRPGTKLIYEVTSGENTYNYIVTVKDLKGENFTWQMTDPVNISGTVQQSAHALQTGYIMFNRFTSGPKKLDDKTTAVWLSQKIFNHLMKMTSKPIGMYLYGSGKKVDSVGTYGNSDDYEITVDGKNEIVQEYPVKPLILVGSEYQPNRNDDVFSFYGNAKFPIILRINLDFTLALKEIQTKPAADNE